MPASFRPLRPADLDLVVAMMEKLYSQASIPFDVGRARGTTEALLSEPEFGGAWMIDVDGTPAGYVVFVLGYSLEFGGRFGLLDELFVDEPWRGQGVAKQALDFAGQQCLDRGWRALRLEVGQGNARAISVYTRAGFQMHDRFLMTKWM